MSEPVVWSGAKGLEEALVPLGELVPYPGNARRHDLDVIVGSLQAHGQYVPIVVNRPTMQVLKGNGTLASSKQLGWSHIAVSYVDVSEEEALRIVLHDNRASDVSGYNDSALLELLQSLDDLEGTGFTQADIIALLPDEADRPRALTDVDDVPDLPAEPVSKRGDVWLLGPHRLLCGDATSSTAVLALMGKDRADAVWTDPPYGVSYVGGTKDHLTIAGDSKAELPGLLPPAFEVLVAAARPGAPVYVAHADTERVIFEQSMRAAGLLVRQNLVWVKSAIVLGRSDYHYRHEPILEASTPDAPSPAPDDDDLEVVTTHDPVLYGFTPGGKGRLGRGGPRWHGDNRTSTVFEVPKPQRNAEHPTMKPVELVLRMLRNSLAPGGIVLDTFAGSGSTLIAAHHHRARAVLVELDPKYVDVVCRRWQAHTGIVPVLQRTGREHDFAQVA